MKTIIIIAANCDGHLPINIACCEEEAAELIASDRANRSSENDDFCPEYYELWERTADGSYACITQITFLIRNHQ